MATITPNDSVEHALPTQRRWWWTVFTAVGWFLWPTVCIAFEYAPPYKPGVVRHDPPDSFVLCFAFLNVRLKVGRRLLRHSSPEETKK